MVAPMDRAFTLQAVATVLEVPYERAKELVDSGQMKGYRLSGQWYVSWADLEAFLESAAYDTTRHERNN